MIYFKSDYTLGAHPEVLKAIEEANLVHTPGYGDDAYCKEAQEILKKTIGRDDAAIHFMVGGTPCNLTSIAAFLRPHEAVIAAYTGHICVHETGSIEATGHKVIHIPSPDGLVYPEEIEKAVAFHVDEHMVKPKFVYISQSSELGTVYSIEHLKALRKTCDRHGLYLYMDGARLSCGLDASDMDIRDCADHTDAFYIGGTKNGALFGEALVIMNEKLKEDFRYMIKQRGGMLAKGKFYGVQFKALFTDDLYFRLGHHSNQLAKKLADGFKAKGYKMYADSPTNQIFPILSNEKIRRLEKDFAFEIQGATDDTHSYVRFVTSFGTTEEEVDALLAAI